MMSFKENLSRRFNKPFKDVSWRNFRQTTPSLDFMQITEQEISSITKIQPKKLPNISASHHGNLPTPISSNGNIGNASNDSRQASGTINAVFGVMPTSHPVSNVPVPYSHVGAQKSSLQIVEDHLLSKVYIRRLYGAIYLYNGKYYIPLTEQDYLILLRRESDEGILSILKTYRAFSDGYRFLLSNPDIEFQNYEKDASRFKTFIAFENTLLDARTGETFDHHPDYPVFFGTNARYTAMPDDTPYWDAFLESTSQGDTKIKQLIYEMLGYLMLQGNDGKCFFVLATAPNSGKSLLGDFIESFFPNCYVSHMAINDFGNRFSLGGLWKTIVNISMDLPQATLNADTVSLIKTLTGDAKITTEEKYMPKVTALNRLKMVFGTNSRISIAIPDSAFWNRVVIIPFMHEVPRREQITDLLSYLIAEKDDILSKSIPYVKKLIARNYEFTLPNAAVFMKNIWVGNVGDTIGDFFTDYCKIVDNKEDNTGIPVQRLLECYQEYCKRKNLIPVVSDTRNFSRIMAERYPVIQKKKCRTPDYENPVSVFTNIQYLCQKGVES